MAVHSGVQFPQGDALAAYKSVFGPLCSQLPEIRSRKDGYGAAPYVKLQTKYETDVTCLMINPYLITNNSFFSVFHKAYAGTKHLAGNTINGSFLSAPLKSMSFGYIDPWNCNRQMTTQALKTAIIVFSSSIADLDAMLDGDLDKISLEELQSQLANVSQTLKDAKKTIFYIYRTYDQTPVTDEEMPAEQVVEGSGTDALREQYMALDRMISSGLFAVQQKVQAKIEQFAVPVPVAQDIPSALPKDTPVGVLVQLPEAVVEELPMIQLQEQVDDLIIVTEETMVDAKLVFKDEVQACRWFCRKLLERRQQIEGTGEQAFKNLTTMARVSGTVPKPFILFAKSLDHVFKDKVALYDFIQCVHGRFTSLLSEKGIVIEVPRPDNFKMLLSDLCAKGASREVYQTLFQALTNREGTGPYGLRFEPAVLNAIMNNGDYFKFFDTEHAIETITKGVGK
ncbi:MAG: hypothetical protein JSR39_08460 [Verrucomicrobia bacterium]|nr:hypothetical protein [Verrucomicrobiota bacterium]